MMRLGQVRWEEALSKFDESLVLSAIRQCRGEYPPSLPSVIDACRARAIHRQYVALPSPRADKVKALAALQAIRSKL